MPQPVANVPAATASLSNWDALLPPSGSEGNPLFTSSEVSAPRVRSGETVPRYLLDQAGEGSLFVETVVARDGSVSAVTVLGGDSELARPVVDALRRERYEPAPHEQFVNGILRLVDQPFFARLAGAGLDTQQPVFVFGLPRSGTTLVEQMAAEFPRVALRPVSSQPLQKSVSRGCCNR